ncbi:MAG: hypothetical protein V4657_13225, partial [Pseudomonadota bacterium]
SWSQPCGNVRPTITQNRQCIQRSATTNQRIYGGNGEGFALHTAWFKVRVDALCLAQILTFCLLG